MINLIIGSAYAQSAQNGANKVVADFIPYILLAVFGVMIVAFLVAVTVLVTTSSNEQNEKKLSAADNIVKTFGGFFIGFATSLLNIGSH